MTQGNYLWYLFAEKTFKYESQQAIIAELLPVAQFPDILEIGCGTGNILLRLSAMDYNCTGVDAAPGRIAIAEEVARNAGNSIRFVCCTAEKFVAPKPVDAAFWANVPLNLEEIEREFVTCATRNVRKGGRMLFDYLMSEHGVQPCVKTWTDELTHEGDRFLPAGLYERLVQFDFSSEPCEVRWVGRRLEPSSTKPLFEFSGELPALTKRGVRKVCESKGWTHIEEVDSGTVVIEGESSGLSYAVDLFQKRF